jgi:drug/metabolite transporter (DMT)-like permease
MRQLGIHAALLVISAVLGSAFIVIKYLLNTSLGPIALTGGRYAVIAGLLIVVLVAYGRRNPIPNRGDWWRLVLMGLQSPIFHLALNWGETQVSAAAAGVLVSTSPIIAAVLSCIFLGERFNTARAFGVVIAFCGVVLVIVRGGEGAEWRMPLTGALVTMIAPLSWAIHDVLSKPVAGKLPPFHITMYTRLLGSAVFLASYGGLWWRAATPELVHLNGVGWIAVVYLGAICTVLQAAVWYRALRVLSATQVQTYLYPVPAFAILFAGIFLHEAITLHLAVGCLLIIAGMALTNAHRLNRTPIGEALA